MFWVWSIPKNRHWLVNDVHGIWFIKAQYFSGIGPVTKCGLRLWQGTTLRDGNGEDSRKAADHTCRVEHAQIAHDCFLAEVD
jgi:hypothetical protein